MFPSCHSKENNPFHTISDNLKVLPQPNRTSFHLPTNMERTRIIILLSAEEETSVPKVSSHLPNAHRHRIFQLDLDFRCSNSKLTFFYCFLFIHTVPYSACVFRPKYLRLTLHKEKWLILLTAVQVQDHGTGISSW